MLSFVSLVYFFKAQLGRVPDSIAGSREVFGLDPSNQVSKIATTNGVASELSDATLNNRRKLLESSSKSKKPYICGDAGASDFLKYNEYAAYQEYAVHIDIDTSLCEFTEIPEYFVSLVDKSGKSPWIGKLAGISSIVRAAPSRFRVIIWDPVMSSAELLEIASTHRWAITWLGVTGSTSGRTTAYQTGWKHGEVTNLIYADVDTSSAGFPVGSKPRYFASLYGMPSFQGIDHWRTTGANVIYTPTATGFRVYVLLLERKNKEDGFVVKNVVKKAESLGWTVGWTGSVDDTTSGVSSSSRWLKVANNAGGAISTKVSPSSHMVKPIFIASVAVNDGAPKDWHCSGTPLVASVTHGSFKMYLGDVVRPVMLEQQGVPMLGAGYANSHWRVNYLAYDVPRNSQLVIVHLRLVDMALESLTPDRKRQMVDDLAGVLQVAVEDIAMFNLKREPGSPNNIICRVQVKTINSKMADKIIAMMKSQKFTKHLSRVMKENGRDSFVVASKNMDFTDEIETDIPIYGQQHGDKYFKVTVAMCITAMFGFLVHYKLSGKFSQVTVHRADGGESTGFGFSRPSVTMSPAALMKKAGLRFFNTGPRAERSDKGVAVRVVGGGWFWEENSEVRQETEM